MNNYISKKQSIKMVGSVINRLDKIGVETKIIGKRIYYPIEIIERYRDVLNNTVYPKSIDYRLNRHIGYETLEELLDSIGVCYVTQKNMPGLERTRIYKKDIGIIKEYFSLLEKQRSQKRIQTEYEKYLSATKDLSTNVKAPLTMNEFRKFVRQRTNSVKNVAQPLINITIKMIDLKKEIFLMNSSDIQKLLFLLGTQREKEEFTLFIKYCKKTWDLPFVIQYKRKNETKGSKTKSRYNDNEWKDFAKLLFIKSPEQRILINSAIKNRQCAMIYLYCALHFVSAMRSEDFIRKINHINLKAALNRTNDEIFEMIKHDYYTREMSASIVNQVVADFFLADKNPAKTNKKSNAAIPFEVSESYVYTLGILLTLCEIHRNLKGKENLMELYIRDTRFHYKLFQGMEFDILSDYFYSSRANKTYLYFNRKTSQDMNYNIGIYLAGIERSHKFERGKRFSETTQRYLASEDERGEREKIELGLFERGVFGFMSRMLLEALCGNDFIELNRDAQDCIINECNWVSPYQMEVILRSVNMQINKANEVMKELLLCNNNDEIVRILKKVAEGMVPGKIPYTHCIAKAVGKDCLESYKQDCISCRFVITEKLILHKLNDVIDDTITLLTEQELEYDIIRYSILLNKTYIPIVCEALDAFGSQVYDFINIDKYNRLLNKLNEEGKYLSDIYRWR